MTDSHLVNIVQSSEKLESVDFNQKWVNRLPEFLKFLLYPEDTGRDEVHDNVEDGLPLVLGEVGMEDSNYVHVV